MKPIIFVGINQWNWFEIHNQSLFGKNKIESIVICVFEIQFKEISLVLQIFWLHNFSILTNVCSKYFGISFFVIFYIFFIYRSHFLHRWKPSVGRLKRLRNGSEINRKCQHKKIEHLASQILGRSDSSWPKGKWDSHRLGSRFYQPKFENWRQN